MSAWASASEQAAVVSMELVRYTRVISGTSMYQSCKVAIASAWRRVRFVHRVLRGWSVARCAPRAVAERARQRPRNISPSASERLLGRSRRKKKSVTVFACFSSSDLSRLLGARPGETRPRTSHRDIASNNSCKLQQLGTHVTINVDTAITPQRLQHAAGTAARSGDLHMQVSVPGRAIHAIPFWDELRTWDPGDYLLTRFL